MRLVLVLLTSVMLSLPAFADITPPGNDDLCEQNPGNPHCHDDGGNGGNGGNGGEGGSSTVNVDISGTIDNSNTNTLDNSNTFNFGGGEEGEGSFNNNNEIDNSSTATTGDQTTTITDNSFDGGNTVIIGGGYGEEGEGSGTLNSDADATATVGDTTATGGNAVIEEGANTNNNTATGGEGGNATIEGGAVVVENNVTIEGGESVPSANSQTVEGDETEINVDARTINEASTVKPAVNSVAPSFSGICNSGAAGQSRGFALSLAVTNDVCQALMIADAYMALGDVEEAHKWVRAAARHAGWKGGLGYIRHLVTLGIL
jgi:hypothetical protein